MITPERKAALRARSRNQAHIVCVHWFAGSSAPKHEPADIEWNEMLDEIDRLESLVPRWRDPSVERPGDNRPVLVALWWDRAHGDTVRRVGVAECEGSSWWDDDDDITGQVVAWMPLPEPPAPENRS